MEQGRSEKREECKEWQEALMSVDVLLIPYGAKRYLYQPSAMLFTAIGFNKPVISSDFMSPEVINEFEIGEFANLGSIDDFGAQLGECVRPCRRDKT